MNSKNKNNEHKNNKSKSQSKKPSRKIVAKDGQRICLDFAARGICKYGDKCKYVHEYSQDQKYQEDDYEEKVFIDRVPQEEVEEVKEVLVVNEVREVVPKIICVNFWVLSRSQIPYVVEGDSVRLECTLTEGKLDHDFYGLFPILRSDAVGVAKIAGPVVSCLSNEGSILQTWKNQEILDEAFELVLPNAQSSVNNLPLEFLRARILSHIRSKMPLWPHVEVQIQQYLLTEEFAQRVLVYTKKRSSLNRTYVEVGVRKFLNAEGQIDEILIDYVVDHYFAIRQNWWRKLTGGSAIIMASWVWQLMMFMSWFLVLNGLEVVEGFVGNISGHYHVEIFWYNILVGVIVTLLYLKNYKELFYEGKAAEIMIRMGEVKLSYASVVELFRQCSQGMDVPEIWSNCKLVCKADLEVPCLKNKTVNSFGTIIDYGQLVVPLGCQHDVYNGLRVRYLFDRPDASEIERALGPVVEHAMDFMSKVKLTLPPITQEDWIEHLPSKRRKIMEDAADYILPEDYDHDIFTKLEPYIGKNKFNFKPRIIHCRRPSFQKALGAWFYAAGKALAEYFNFARSNLIYDMNLDALTLGEIAELCSGLATMLEIDVSNWDGSIQHIWLLFEIWVIENCFDSLPPEWDEVKKHWTDNVGVSKYGISYKLIMVDVLAICGPVHLIL